MKIRHILPLGTHSIVLAAALVLPVSGQLVHEPFDYADGTINGVSSYGGGSGLTGFWEGSTTNVPFSMSDGTGHAHGGAGEPGLEFPGLSTTGSVTLTRKSAPGGAEVHREVAAAVLPSLTADDTTIYFSVLVRTKYYSVGNENLAFMFSTDTAADPNQKPVTMAGGEGIGFALKGSGSVIDFQAIAVDDAGEGGVTSVSALGGLATDTPTIFMIVGEIEWGASSDTISLYSVTDVNAALPAAFATLSADLDQSQFNTITIAGQQVSSLDEIRFGTTLADVGVVPTGGGNGFADWIAGFDVGADDGFDQDADGDGIDNGVEGWFGTNPGVGNAGLTQTGKVGNVFSFEHPEADPPLTDVTGSYEWSIDLAAWNASGTVGDTTVVITPTPGGGTTTVEADTTGSTVAPAKLFVRAVATQN